VLITIPASDEYPILNLSHATHTVLYEFFMAMHSEPRRSEPADKREKEMMFSYFGDLLDAIDYPKERRANTTVMFRRMMGRAVPSKHEYNTIMGVFGDASKFLKYGKPWEKKKN
jgi:tRNA C32,U32 (ribose-2'-O)-methylase TrmJ